MKDKDEIPHSFLNDFIDKYPKSTPMLLSTHTYPTSAPSTYPLSLADRIGTTTALKQAPDTIRPSTLVEHEQTRLRD